LNEIGKKQLSLVISNHVLPKLGFQKIEKPVWDAPQNNSFKPHTSDGVEGIKHQVIIVKEIDHPDFHSATNVAQMASALERHLRKVTKCEEVSVEKVGASYFIKHPRISIQYGAQ